MNPIFRYLFLYKYYFRTIFKLFYMNKYGLKHLFLRERFIINVFLDIICLQRYFNIFVGISADILLEKLQRYFSMQI